MGKEEGESSGLRVLCSMYPDEFLEEAELVPASKHMNHHMQFARDLQKAFIRSKAWHELKVESADVFAEDDTRLTARFTEMSGGLTNTCFRLQTNKGNFFLRVPGEGSEDHLSRQDEAYNLKVAQRLGMNIEIHFLNPKTGFYAGEFLENAMPLSKELLSERKTMKDVASVFKALHSSHEKFKNNITIFDRLRQLQGQIKHYKHHLLHDAKELNKRLNDLAKICKQDNSPLVACHNDPTHVNFLYHGNKLKLLDWEYSGNNKAMFDLANFAKTSNLSKDQEQCLLQAYYGKSPTKQVWQIFSAYKQLTALWYYLWSEVQLANHSNVVPRKELTELANQNWDYVMVNHFQLPQTQAKAYFPKTF